MVAVLTRLLGLANVETAHDIAQDTLLQAMNSWSYGQIPDNPSAWLHRVARNKAVDFLRRKKKFKQIEPEYAHLLESEYTLGSTMQHIFLDSEISDSMLRMMFACCHPSISAESQVALILRTLCGLTVNEIARVFLTSEDTIGKRLYRAKEKMRVESFDSPGQLGPRLDPVLKSLYLLFNEGYNSSQPDRLIREDLCSEAIRLCILLTRHPQTSCPRAKALLSLMCFQASRLRARLDDHGNIVLLKHQDRRLWNRSLIREGFDNLEAATEPFEISTYHLEAAIASLHAAAPDFERTDWKSVYHLYELLHQLQPNPFVAMNKAIASAYAISRQQALEELGRIKGLEQHHLFYATLGEIYLDLDQKDTARQHFEKAFTLTASLPERQLLRQKLEQC